MKIELTPQQVHSVVFNSPWETRTAVFDQIMVLAEKGAQEPPLPKVVPPVEPGCDSGVNALCDNESISELLATVTQYENSYGDNIIKTRIGMWMRAIPNLSAENALELCNRLRNAQLYYQIKNFDTI
jgi:hypothetical protein